jgi:hypothetical protein
MTVSARLVNEYDPERVFKILPVYDGEMSEDKKECKEFIRNLPNGTIIPLIRPLRFVKCVEISIVWNSRCKCVKLTRHGVTITGCKSLNEAFEVLEFLKLNVTDLQEKMVCYQYNLPMKNTGECRLKYKKTTFIIRNEHVIQSSPSLIEAREAYNYLIENL